MDIPQLFYAKRNGALSIMLVKIVGDILISGSYEVADYIILRFNSKFQLGTIVHVLGRLGKFGFNILQHDE